MKAKKILILALILALTIAMFTGCGKSDQTVEDQSAPPSAETDAQPALTQPSSSNQSQGNENQASGNDDQQTAEPIKIGHICDMTGVQAQTGEEFRKAVEYAVESLGGTIAGRPVEIILGDAQDQPSVAVDVARKMVEVDGVIAIFGPTQNGHKAAVAEYMQSVGIPLIIYTPTPPNLWQGNDWVVGSGGSTAQMPSVMADYAFNELGYRTIHTISRDDTAGQAYINPFVETFTALGGTVLSQQWAPPLTTDFAPYFVTLSDADAIVAWVSGSDSIAMWTAWYELGINERMPIVAAQHGGFTDYFIIEAISKGNPAVAEAMQGMYVPIMYSYSIPTPENQEFVEGWTAKFGAVPAGTNTPGASAQTVYLIKAAIESLDGDTSPEKLIKALLEIDFTGPEGHMYFENLHVTTKDVYIAQIVRLADGSYNYEVVNTYKDVPPPGLSN